MTALTRIKIIVFAVMIFGAFANFAQNEWGNDLIVVCEGLLAASFLFGAIKYTLDKMKHKNRLFINVTEVVLTVLISLVFAVMFSRRAHFTMGTFIEFIIYIFILWCPIFALSDLIYAAVKKQIRSVSFLRAESFLIFLGFIGASFNSLLISGVLISGGCLLILVSIAPLVFFYTFDNFRLARKQLQENKSARLIMTAATISNILLATGLLFSMLHIRGDGIFLYMGIGIAAIFILIAIARIKHKSGKVQESQANVFTLPKTNFFLFYSILFIFSIYTVLADSKIAPAFYSRHFPANIYKIANSSTVTESSTAKVISMQYESLIIHSKQNGFIK